MVVIRCIDINIQPFLIASGAWIKTIVHYGNAIEVLYKNSFTDFIKK